MNKRILDKLFKGLLLLITLICASAIFAIVLIIIIKGVKPFIVYYPLNGNMVKADLKNFLLGTSWEKTPTDFGIFFILINTFYVTILSIIIATPISVLSALFIARMAPLPIKKILLVVSEILASIPSIIYGLFGAGVVTILIKNIANIFNYQTAGGLSTLTTIIVLSMMIMPTITTISVTSIQSVKEDYVKASLALGASVTQTNFKVVLKGAKEGILSGVILAIGRAIGEATAVTMVCGNAQSGPTFNLFDITRTLTSTMLSGISESNGIKYDIRFSIAIVLLLLIIIINLILNQVKKRIAK